MKTAQQKQTEVKYDFETHSEIAGKVVENVPCEIDKDNSINLSELVKDRPRLVLRISSTNCGPCRDQQLDRINEMFKQSDDIIVLSSHNTSRDFAVFKSTNRTKAPVYRVPKEEMEWDVNAPFYFVLNKNMSVSNVHIPDIHTQYERQKTVQYLINVKNLLNAE